MKNQIKLIADRIKELRDIMDYTSVYVANKIGITEAEYLGYESGIVDIPIGVMYNVADVLGVDPTVLLTGDDPKMTSYTIVRKGKGVHIERYEGYEFTSLAANYIGRELEPMIVTLKKSDTCELVTHPGQEFNYILEGSVTVVIGGKEFLLEEGDSIYFDPQVPHGQKTSEPKARFLTVINENMKRK